MQSFRAMVFGSGVRIVCLALCLALVQPKEQPPNFAVVGYLPEWRYAGANWSTLTTHLTHLLLFSLEVDGSGGVAALDRLPAAESLAELRTAARRSGTQVLLCFGGNGRSGAFRKVVRSEALRTTFVRQLTNLVASLDLDGVDYNWEYPGYDFGRGYLPDHEVHADYEGLTRLLADTRRAFDKAAPATRWSITMAYYPDGKQEQLLVRHGAAQHADLLHSMSYDQHGQHHSTREFAQQVIDQAVLSGLPPAKCTLGLPFYARSVRTGDWASYEDLVQQHGPLRPGQDRVTTRDSSDTLAFNGVATIQAKTRAAHDAGLGGVMIWEAGQDCRLAPVERDRTTHVRTCRTDEDSLLVAITATVREMSKQASRAEF